MELKNIFVQDLAGNAIPGAIGRLYLQGTTTLAGGLQDKDGNAQGNPFQANQIGQIQVAAPDGRYDLYIESAARNYTIRMEFFETAPATNVAALGALVPQANKGFYFTDSQGNMALYDLGDLGRLLASLSNTIQGMQAGRQALGALGSSENAASASKLNTPRTIQATGDATWSTTFDGSGNVSAALTLAASGVSAGTYVLLTVDAKGRVTGGVVSPLPLANGGTGATTAAGALAALSAAARGANSDITSLSAIVGTAFTSLTLANGWALIPGYRASYRKNLGMLQIEMAISGGTSTDGTILATLPAGFRPPLPVAVPVASISAAGVVSSRVTIGTDGTIKIFNCSSQIVFAATVALE